MKYFKKLMVLGIAGLIGLSSLAFADNESNSIQNFVQNNFIAFYTYCTEGVGDGNGLVGLDCSTFTMSTEPYHIVFSPGDSTSLLFNVVGTNYNGVVSFTDGGFSVDVSGGGDSESSSSSIITSEQVSGMGTALAIGGSSLLKIGIQILPYAIAFTIILIIFRLIKNWSRLKNYFNGTNAPVNILGKKWANKHPESYNKAYRRWDKRSAKRLARKFGGDPKHYYFGNGGSR